jgi:hypothetical protein
MMDAAGPSSASRQPLVGVAFLDTEEDMPTSGRDCPNGADARLTRSGAGVRAGIRSMSGGQGHGAAPGDADAGIEGVDGTSCKATLMAIADDGIPPARRTAASSLPVNAGT